MSFLPWPKESFSQRFLSNPASYVRTEATNQSLVETSIETLRNQVLLPLNPKLKYQLQNYLVYIHKTSWLGDSKTWCQSFQHSPESTTFRSKLLRSPASQKEISQTHNTVRTTKGGP